MEFDSRETKIVRRPSLESVCTACEVKGKSKAAVADMKRRIEAEIQNGINEDELEKAFTAVTSEPAEQIRHLNLAEEILRYISISSERAERAESVIKSMAQINAELLSTNTKREANMLTEAKMRHALREEIPNIPVVNVHHELFDRVELEFAEIERSLVKTMTEQMALQASKYNLIIILLVIIIALLVIL